MYLVDNPSSDYHGTMDYDRMMDEINMTETQRMNAETARMGIMETKLDILDTTNQTLSMVQQYTKMGFF